MRQRDVQTRELEDTSQDDTAPRLRPPANRRPSTVGADGNSIADSVCVSTTTTQARGRAAGGGGGDHVRADRTR